VDAENREDLSLKQLIESFIDHPTMKDIADEDSVIRKVMTDPIFVKSKDKDDRYHIPSLMILGLLYCVSDPRTKA